MAEGEVRNGRASQGMSETSLRLLRNATSEGGSRRTKDTTTIGESKSEDIKSNALWWLYLLAIIPTLTELFETSRLPVSPREIISDAILTVILLAIAWKVRRLYGRLAHVSTTDTLTGLYNRGRFQGDLRREVHRAQRLGTSLVLAYIDADSFKTVNDTLGHNVGDQVLQIIADLLDGATRRGVDRCYRIGGDEFAVLMPGGDSDGAQTSAKRIEQLGTHEVAVLAGFGSGLSVGAATLTSHESPEQFARRADELMYTQKHSKPHASIASTVGGQHVHV
ncbi:GGDEF domain-containing protein [Myxococcota bacterium]